MLLKNLNSYAISKLRGVLILVLIVTIALITTIVFYNSYLNDKNTAVAKVNAMQSNINTVNKSIARSENSIEIWNSIARKKHGQRTGLRVEPARNVIDQLKQLHRINNLTINLSNPVKRLDLNQTKYSTIAYSIVSMSFNSYTDSDAFKFITSIMRELPGHVQIKNLSIVGTDVLTDEVLDNIVSGDFTNVVTVKVEFVWQDIQDKTKVSEK